MVDYYVVYWGNEGDPARPSFELITPSLARNKQYKERVIPGTEEMDPLYVRRYSRQLDRDRLYLICFTQEELTAFQIKNLMNLAVKFVAAQGI